MTAHRVIVTAAGESSRWQMHTGVPKHLVNVDGEPLLHRTVRQLLETDPSADVWVTGPRDERYDAPGARLFTPEWRPDYRECSAYVWPHQLWNEDGKTTFMYGDTYYTDAAVRTILNGPESWHMFARLSGSRLTGKTWSEVWAHSFMPSEHRLEQHAILRAYADPWAPRASIYEMYKYIRGLPLQPFSWATPNLGALTEIDDWTEDFDFPKDYDNFVARRRWPNT